MDNYIMANYIIIIIILNNVTVQGYAALAFMKCFHIQYLILPLQLTGYYLSLI